ncbi:MAG: hypothetical protein ABW040_08370 [Microbacteriaceae bacterium]
MRRGWSIAADVGLWVAATVGTICIVATVCAVAFGMQIVLFSTGSMSPTIPAGAAALTREIPASSIAVGDVVTVERPGKLPITHRVVEVGPSATAPGFRLIEMRGDANAVDDPLPYDVDRVRLVIASVPGVAPMISSLRSPWVLGAVTLAATALVVVVCWPRRRRPPVADDRSTDAASRASVNAALVVAVIAIAGTGTLVGAQPAAAAAAPNVRVVQGDIIRLTSIEDAGMSSLVPGAEAIWQVGVSAEAPGPGMIEVTTVSRGDPDLHLRYDISICAQEWADDACAAPRVVIEDSPVPLDGASRELDRFSASGQAWVRVAVRMPATVDPDVDGRVDVRIQASGLGDDVAVGPGGTGTLPDTGAPVSWAVGAAGVFLLGLGAVLILRRARAR